MIRSLEVVGLNRRITDRWEFHEDVNVITGRNGAGKTSILKLLWFMTSGNLELVVPELVFEKAVIITDEYMLSVTIHEEPTQLYDQDTVTYEIKFHDQDEITAVNAPINAIISETRIINSRGNIRRSRTDFMVDSINRKMLESETGSIFFPTFRRIEGGFTMSRPRFFDRGDYERREMYGSERPNIQDAMATLSQNLSVRQHRFVASISTDDIVDILTRQYANVSEAINNDHNRLSASIISQIREYGRVGKDTSSAEASEVLERILRAVTANSEKQEQMLKPFTALGDLVTRIFQHKGIKLTSKITLGEAREAVSSDALSAGEKQLLSFVAYNAFNQNCTIFIDEPEISLHVDWQRILLRTLLSQGTNNQFIVATHSPFIYTKYADKEIQINPDRGGDL